MAETRWTQNQKEAIEARRGTILVSAAAGSGKTAVLSERVIERLTDDNPTPADKLLIVTFTKKAAAEMKQRIQAKFRDVLKNNPTDAMKKQHMLLNKMQVSTVHSFCSSLVKEYFYKLDIDPSFTLSDENGPQMEQLKDEVMKALLEYKYSSNSESFMRFADMFSNEKNDNGVVNVIMSLFNFTRSMPFPDEWMDKILAEYNYNQGVENTLWGNIIRKDIQDKISQCVKAAEAALVILNNDDRKGVLGKIIDLINEEIAQLDALELACNHSTWDEMADAIASFKTGRFSTPKGMKDDSTVVQVKALREKYAGTKGAVKKIGESLVTAQEFAEDIDVTRELIKELFDCVKLFSTVLSSEKKERGIAEYSDLEFWTLKLLYDETENGHVISDFARELSNRYDEIIVDEYQDSNEVQEMIFKAVSHDETNLFFVGDIKQSIYSFRQSDPSMFINRRSQYQLYDEGQDNYPARINLDRNFRSRQTVTDSVNFIFKQLMSEQCGDIDYNDEEALVAAAAYEDGENNETELHIIDKSLDDSNKESNEVLEARLIAELISKMINDGYRVKDESGNGTRPAEYSDFTILLRSFKNRASVYTKELNSLGIPTFSNDNPGFFSTAEVSVIISLLKVIDNPNDDYPLAAVLMSEIYGFTPDDMAIIHATARRTSLYRKLLALKDDNSRINDFFTQLDDFKKMSTRMSTNRLLNYIYEKSGYINIVQSMKNGEKRMANLRMLSEFAALMEDSGINGVSAFLRLVKHMEDKGSDIESAVVQNTENAVQIMTIHKSKGLEFPICIVAGMGNSFRNDTDSVQLHKELGVGCKLKEDVYSEEKTTLISEAIKNKKKIEGRSEDLRVLYVALTRAKEKLIMVGTKKSDLDKSLSNIAVGLDDGEKVNPAMVADAGNMLDWLLMCMLRHPNGEMLRDMLDIEVSSVESDCTFKVELHKPLGAEKLEEQEVVQAEPDGELLDDIKELTSFEYQYSNLMKVPAKVTASRLAEEKNTFDTIIMSRPQFAESEGFTPVEKGTATHELLQYCDYKKATDDLEQEIDRLVSIGHISQAQGDAVDREMMEKFLQSDICSRVMSSDKVYREYRFTVEIPAEMIEQEATGSSENIILQGAVDLAFVEDGKLVIVDYKTDRVRSERDLWNRYNTQLEMYGYAMNKCTGLEVKEIMLYSMFLAKEIKANTI